jgi:hypothetical protein
MKRGKAQIPDDAQGLYPIPDEPHHFARDQTVEILAL